MTVPPPARGSRVGWVGRAHRCKLARHAHRAARASRPHQRALDRHQPAPAHGWPHRRRRSTRVQKGVAGSSARRGNGSHLLNRHRTAPRTAGAPPRRRECHLLADCIGALRVRTAGHLCTSTRALVKKRLRTIHLHPMGMGWTRSGAPGGEDSARGADTTRSRAETRRRQRRNEYYD